ncbi:hypothetical protein [Streptomyces cellostaticus]|uniref:hypothetical protein n=1 Tax=Streptomyces cellostaticus TaxID=67285 RepID=UPI00131C8259|nr:hypothetical protein [Streptomyces cellostaticus]
MRRTLPTARANSSVAEGPDPLVHQCRLPLSSVTPDVVTNLIPARLKKIGSRWHKLPPHRIALITLMIRRPWVEAHPPHWAGL